MVIERDGHLDGIAQGDDELGLGVHGQDPGHGRTRVQVPGRGLARDPVARRSLKEGQVFLLRFYILKRQITAEKLGFFFIAEKHLVMVFKIPIDGRGTAFRGAGNEEVRHAHISHVGLHSWSLCYIRKTLGALGQHRPFGDPRPFGRRRSTP
jgi:hypothetical protein